LKRNKTGQIPEYNRKRPYCSLGIPLLFEGKTLDDIMKEERETKTIFLQ
jgi:hypothetical protein